MDRNGYEREREEITLCPVIPIATRECYRRRVYRRGIVVHVGPEVNRRRRLSTDCTSKSSIFLLALPYSLKKVPTTVQDDDR